MKKILIKALNDPFYALHVLKTRYINLSFRRLIFTNTKEFRSESDNGLYSGAIIKALNNQKSFEKFKRHYSYRDILEHVNREHGGDYLEIVRKRKDGLIEKAIINVLRSDDLGKPIKYKYSGIDFPLSPTTLRYLKVASDLNGLFPDDLCDVAEIGCGYGGQAYVNDQLLNVEMTTLFDLPFVNKLIERYLNALLMKGAFKTISINQAISKNYDLVISNYAFSELPSALQNAYIKKVLSRSSRGYLTMNSGLGGASSEGKMTLDELRERLPEFEVYKEEPISSTFNYIIVWGHNTEFANSNMHLKKI